MATGSDLLHAANVTRAFGPVWCARRGQSAVVSLVTPNSPVVGPYIQWCSLVGVDVTCDEACVCSGARWAASATAAPALTRDVYGPLQGLVAAVETRLQSLDTDAFAPWREWARTFAAGVCSPSAAWGAAEAARHEATACADDMGMRRAGLAAEDAAWAVAHATAGNLSLSLQCAAAARRLIETAG